MQRLNFQIKFRTESYKLLVLLFSLSCLTFADQIASAQTVESDQLSGTLSEDFGGEFFDLYKISPDGKYVVYTAFDNSLQLMRLYSVPVGGGPAVSLSRVVDDLGIFDYEISADSATVVYRTTELVSVPITGGTQVEIDSITPNNSIFYRISPASDRVVYTAGFNNLISVPISGGSEEILTGSDFIDGDIDFFKFSPDGSHVVSTSFERDGASFRSVIFSVPTEGGDIINLTSPLPTFDTVRSYQISPDSLRVVYQANLADATQFNTQLFSVELTGGTVTKLSSSPVPLSADGGVFGFEISDNSDQVLYVFSDFSGSANSLLLLTSIDTNNSIQLNNNTDGNNSLCGFEFVSGSNEVVYCASFKNNDKFLYKVSESGQNPTKLNNSYPFKGDRSFNYSISNDGSYVVIHTVDIVNNDFQHQLFSISLSGNAANKLYDVTRSNLGCFDEYFQITADSRQIVYCGFSSSSINSPSLFSLDITGNNQTLLSDHSPSVFPVYFFDVTSDSKTAIYVAETSPLNVTIDDLELFAISLDGPDNDDFHAPDNDDFCFPIMSADDSIAVICL